MTNKLKFPALWKKAAMWVKTQAKPDIALSDQIIKRNHLTERKGRMTRPEN
jgi:hypothetical protein